MNIYIDMDEVVSDFMGYARKVLNKPRVGDFQDEVKVPFLDWKKLTNNPRLYKDLELRKDAHEVVAYILNYANTHDGVFVAFLSAIPKNNDVPWAFQDKVHWANKHFPGVPVFLGPYSADKAHHCKSADDILIDDRTSNCNEFIAAGGKAHVYRTWPKCKAWLDEVLPK
jgi:hypothetical protein